MPPVFNLLFWICAVKALKQQPGFVLLALVVVWLLTMALSYGVLELTKNVLASIIIEIIRGPLVVFGVGK